MSTPEILSLPVVVDTIPEEGRTWEIAVTPAQLQAIAATFGLLELRRLAARLQALPGKRGAVDITGRLTAELVQACVVTLAPVVQMIDVPVDRHFTVEEPASVKAAPEIVVEPGDEEEPPDVYDNGQIDLGAVVIEELALSIDPYPRAPGAELPAAADGAAAAQSPFAALAAFKRER